MEQKQLFKIRDLRKKDQYKIDDKYLNGYAKILGVYSTAVYNSLARHSEFYTQKAFPSEKLIAEEHNITDRSVRNAIEKLKRANILQIKKERSNKGQWLNNIYFLIDKSEWKQPEELKDTARGIESAIKDNTLRRITHKKDNITATQSVASDYDYKIINRLIELFKLVNPSYERFYGNKTQRQAIERLLKRFGEEKLEKIIKFLPKIFGKPFAPVITTPYLLEQKLANLISYIERYKHNSNLIKI